MVDVAKITAYLLELFLVICAIPVGQELVVAAVDRG